MDIISSVRYMYVICQFQQTCAVEISQRVYFVCGKIITEFDMRIKKNRSSGIDFPFNKASRKCCSGIDFPAHLTFVIDTNFHTRVMIELPEPRESSSIVHLPFVPAVGLGDRRISTLQRVRSLAKCTTSFLSLISFIHLIFNLHLGLLLHISKSQFAKLIIISTGNGINVRVHS